MYIVYMCLCVHCACICMLQCTYLHLIRIYAICMSIHIANSIPVYIRMCMCMPYACTYRLQYTCVHCMYIDECTRYASACMLAYLCTFAIWMCVCSMLVHTQSTCLYAIYIFGCVYTLYIYTTWIWMCVYSVRTQCTYVHYTYSDVCTLYACTRVTVYHIRTPCGCKCVCALWDQEQGSRRDPRTHHLAGTGECRMETVVCCNLVEIWQVTVPFATIQEQSLH